MCGIVGSFDLSELRRNYHQVAERGTVRQSLLSVDYSTGEIKDRWVDDNLRQAWELFDPLGDRNLYYILHVQSPTGMVSKVHPASPHREPDMNIHLWHNGMMDSRIQTASYKERWDTEVLRDAIVDVGLRSTLESFEGSFACIVAGTDVSTEYKLICFRNRISPLFYKGSSLCSVKVDSDWARVPPGIVFGITKSGHEELITFNNEYNPFGV